MMMMMISTWIKLASKRSFGLQTLERKSEKFERFLCQFVKWKLAATICEEVLFFTLD